MAASCLATLGLLCLIWVPYLPNAAGRLGVDYAFWLPNLLAGVFWHLRSPALAMPWFSPSHCAGVPFHADPQGAYLSVSQALAFFVGPLRAVQLSFILYAAAGYLGTYALARRRFGVSGSASVLAAALFCLNGLYSARMMVGHLGFAPFMLTPLLALCALRERHARGVGAARVLLFAVVFAVMIQGGMAVLVPPVFCALAMLMVLHALAADGSLGSACATMASGSLLGLLLCAGKLSAVLALMAHVPRDLYPLPGFPNIAVAAWAAFRSVFLWPSGAMTDETVNNALTLEVHEFDDRVGPVPLLLLAALCWRAWPGRARWAASPRARLLGEALLFLLLVPLALNTYAAQWTAFLKQVPVLRNASSLLRFFAAYIPLLCVAAGLALDRLLPAGGRVRMAAAGAGVALTCAGLLAGGRAAYGPSGVGVYDPAPIEASWRAAVASGDVPAIHALAVPLGKDGTPDPSIARQNVLTEGLSPLFCYDPLFGYRLELFRQGTLHPGPVLDRTQAGGRTELNVKNPACYVFPEANACAPGDPFRADQEKQALAFAAYLPFVFAKPWWARLADWVGMLSALGVAAGLLVCGAAAWRQRSARA